MSETKLYPWLCIAHAVGSSTATCDIIRFFGSAEKVLNAQRGELIESGIADDAFYNKIHSVNDSIIQKAFNDCRENDWQIITPESKFYPPLLSTISDFPLVLFAEGTMGTLAQEPKIGIVGTRTPKDEGLDAACRLAMGASSCGIVVVSGAEEGVDTSAHDGAMLGSAGTIGVLGFGLGGDYLSSRKTLRLRISNEGVLISELFPFAPPSQNISYEQNRIIAGMSNAVAVIEADASDGSLIAAECAISQKRDLYVPSEKIILSEGCERLIKQGATTVEKVGEVVRVYKGMIPEEKWNEFCLNLSMTDAAHMGARFYYDSDYYIPNQSLKIVTVDADGRRKCIQYENFRKTEWCSSQLECQYETPETDEASENSDGSGGKKAKKSQKNKPIPILEGDEKLIYDALSDKPMQYDEIKYTTGLQVHKIMCAITMLEIKRLIVSHPGGRFTRAK